MTPITTMADFQQRQRDRQSERQLQDGLLQEPIDLPTLPNMVFRRIVPEDLTALKRGFQALSDEEIRYRFFTPLKSFPETLAQRVIQANPKEAWVMGATGRSPPGHTYVGALIEAYPQQEGELQGTAEFAILVPKLFQKKGLGSWMMKAMERWAHEHGIHTLMGQTMQENTGMISLAKKLGYHVYSELGDPGIMHMKKVLAPQPQPMKRYKAA